MENFAIVASLIILEIVLYAVWNTVNFLLFLNSFHNSAQVEHQPNVKLPKAAIVLSVRGADPSLADCVNALLMQDHPDYMLQVVVDSLEDPAWPIVNQVVQASGLSHVQVSPLRTYYDTCSLKCSALIQAISELDHSYAVVASVDSDVITHPGWLRALVQPLSDPKIGVTSGSRWYLPITHSSNNQWSSLCRYVWNIASSVTMYWLKIPWGGSMAMTRAVLARALPVWQQTITDDTPLTEAASNLGLQIKFIPALVMINREECDWAGYLRFVTRQLLFTRLYHRGWWVILSQALIFAVGLILPIAVLLVALRHDRIDIVGWMGAALLSYLLSFSIGYLLLERGVRRIAAARSETMTAFSLGAIAKILLLMPVMVLLNAWLSLWVMIKRSVQWRGITYQIHAGNQITLQAYQTYQSANPLPGLSVQLATNPLPDSKLSIL
jgi:cellulose synthase/poly-beta-1,6-N-acetylglucosamine synthase-like glycosyltransferase